MRPGALRRALVVAGCGVLTVTLSACESTEQESAKITREGLAGAGGALKLGAVNRAVKVSDVTLVSGGGRMALAAKLSSSASRDQANLPLLVNVTGAGGRVLYSNDAAGLESSLQHLGLLRAHQSAWWVDDQVLTSQHTTAVKVTVGSGSSTASGSGAGSGARAKLATSAVRTRVQGGVSVLSGRLINRSGGAQSQITVFAVALKGGRVTAAGRVVVPSVSARRGASAPFQIFLIGTVAGAKVELSAVPAGG